MAASILEVPITEARAMVSVKTAEDDLTFLWRETKITLELQARMIELHKGHGPTIFKTFQKVFALGMVFIMVSGLWLGLTAPRLVRNTTISFGAGLALFLVLVLA